MTPGPDDVSSLRRRRLIEDVGAAPNDGVCSWCRRELAATHPGVVDAAGVSDTSPTARATRAKYCGRKCRQAAFRLRRRRATCGEVGSDKVLSFAYADPPYPGRARKYYGREPTFAGEVDHAALIASLAAAGYAGWALSTAADALRDVLPLCPPGARVCAWVKPIGVSSRTYGLHNTWEPLIVVPGRRLRPGRRDWLSAQPARFGGTLAGRKPIAFCAWLFDCLGILPGDTLVDLFPGTGIVAQAWREASNDARAPYRGLFPSSEYSDDDTGVRA